MILFLLSPLPSPFPIRSGEWTLWSIEIAFETNCTMHKMGPSMTEHGRNPGSRESGVGGSMEYLGTLGMRRCKAEVR